MTPLLVSSGLETMLNWYLQQDSQSSKFLSPLQGKVFLIHLTDLGFTLFLVPHEQGIQIQSTYANIPNLTLRGKSTDFAKMHFDTNKANALFQGTIEIDGEVELAGQLQQLFNSIELDWEEWLSKFSGDFIAHQIGNWIRGASVQAKQSLQTLQCDAGEYLQEESHQLASSLDVRDLLDKIDDIRTDTDRMEARIARISRLLLNKDKLSDRTQTLD